MSAVLEGLLSAALIALVISLLFLLPACILHRKLKALLMHVYRGEFYEDPFFEFRPARAEQLYFPFAWAELCTVANASALSRQELNIRLLYPARAVFLGEFNYLVRACYEGSDERGAAFTLDRKGYLCIRCSWDLRRGYHPPVIRHIETRKY